MAQPMSNEKRADIIKHMQAWASKKEIATWLFVCVRTVTRVWNKFTAVGSYEAAPKNSGRKSLITEETMNSVVSKIEEMPDITLNKLIDEFKLPISESCIEGKKNKGNGHRNSSRKNTKRKYSYT